MLTATIAHQRLIKICIAVNAPVFAGVVCPDVYAGNTAACAAIPYVLRSISSAQVSIEMPCFVAISWKQAASSSASSKEGGRIPSGAM